MRQVNHEQLKQLINVYYEKKLALLVYGTFGIGKSYSIREQSEQIAKDKKRKFVEWNRLTYEEKENVYTNVKQYFVLIDIRLSEYDSTDTKGLPNFKSDKESVEWKLPFWAKVLEKEESDGILFFDEINLAPQLVISSVYKIIYDRIIGESKIADEWSIIGAGNLDTDRAYTQELAPPVRDRGGEVELIGAEAKDWCTKWATKNGIDKRVIGYLLWRKSNIHVVNFEDNQKYTTYRGWERVSKLIKSSESQDVKQTKEEKSKMYTTMELVCSSAIGEGIAREFVAFCKIKDSVNLDAIIKDPTQLKTIDKIDVRYFILVSFAEKFKENKDVNFNKIIKVTKVLDDLGQGEFIGMLWKLCTNYNKKAFETGILSKSKDTLIDKYMEFIIG